MRAASPSKKRTKSRSHQLWREMALQRAKWPRRGKANHQIRREKPAVVKLLKARPTRKRQKAVASPIRRSDFNTVLWRGRSPHKLYELHAVVTRNHLCGLFTDHDRRCVGVAANYVGHNTRIGHA